MFNLPHEPAGPRGRPPSRRLAEIADILATAPGVREELVSDIKTQLETGSYQNEEKLNLAIYLMLKDLLR